MSVKEKPDGRKTKNLLKLAIEKCAPDLRRVMAQPRRGKVTAVKKAGGKYVCTIQPVLNDGRPDPAAPVIPDVEIPLIWAGPNRGLVCPPTVGEYCDVGFYDGDANSPFITNFRPNGQAPEADLDEFMIQQEGGVRFGFQADGTFVIDAPRVVVTAPQVIINGDVQVNGNINVSGSIYASGTIIDGSGNTNHHVH